MYSVVLGVQFKDIVVVRSLYTFITNVMEF